MVVLIDHPAVHTKVHTVPYRAHGRYGLYYLCKMLCPLSRYKLIQQQSMEINIKNQGFLYKQSCHYLEMLILTKCLPVMRVMRGLQTVMWDRQGVSTFIERTIIGGGLILLMGVYR